MGIERRYDQILYDIEQMRNLSSKRHEKINLHWTLTVKEAVWVSKKLYEEIDRGIFSANFHIIPSKYSIELIIDLILQATEKIIVERTINHLCDRLSDYFHERKK